MCRKETAYIFRFPFSFQQARRVPSFPFPSSRDPGVLSKAFDKPSNVPTHCFSKTSRRPNPKQHQFRASQSFVSAWSITASKKFAQVSRLSEPRHNFDKKENTSVDSHDARTVHLFLPQEILITPSGTLIAVMLTRKQLRLKGLDLSLQGVLLAAQAASYGIRTAYEVSQQRHGHLLGEDRGRRHVTGPSDPQPFAKAGKGYNGESLTLSLG